jgi:hypothetical protein
MGMSMIDFERCTPTEFYAVYENWSRRQEQSEHAKWDRIRMVCMSILQPYSKKNLTPRDVLVFPWEEDDDVNKATTRQETAAEIQTRYIAAKRRMGLK